MSDQPENLAAIIQSARNRADNYRHDGWESVAEELEDLVDRVDAAAERERAALDAARKVAKDTAEQYRKLYEKKKEAENQLAELEERHPIVLEQSNAAAMRAALEKIRLEYGWGRIGCRTCVSSEADVERVSDLFEKQIDAALSAPARNCDRFKTLEEAREAYWAYREPLEFNNKPFVAITEWLFAPAEGGDHAD